MIQNMKIHSLNWTEQKQTNTYEKNEGILGTLISKIVSNYDSVNWINVLS